jgi:arylsulfatase A-like enzyme
MEVPPGHSAEVVRQETAREPATWSHPPQLTLGATLLVAVWLGLIAGYLDLGIVVVRKRLLDHDFYRMGDDFVWLIPLGVTILVMASAIVLALGALIARKTARLEVVVGLLSFIGILDFAVRLPIAFWGALLLSAGCATQFVRLVRSRTPQCLRLARITVPFLIGALLLLTVGTIGRRIWTEHHAVAALPRSPPAARNVLLVVWDTVRADNLGLHGHVRPTTPNLARLAARGVRFDQAFSTSSWTLPAHASMFTGRWPHELRVDWTAPLGKDFPTLAEYLAANGYDTAGFVANVDYCSRETGLARGFAHYEDYPVDLREALVRDIGLGHALDLSDWTGALGMLLEKCTGRLCNLIPRANEHVKDASEVNRAFLSWLRGREKQHRPFFAFLNLNDAHTPNEVPDESIPRFGLRPANNWDRLTLRHVNSLNKARLSRDHVRMIGDLYDDCISYLDLQLGVLLQELENRGVLKDTLVIVTADHGEHLGDHLLFFHGCSLYRQLVHVPLVIVNPDMVPADRVIMDPVSLRELPATVVRLLGLDRDASFPGQSLARFWNRSDGDLPPQVELLLMETGKPLYPVNEGREPATKGPMKAVIAGELHYIRSGDGGEELYNLKSDRKEAVNLAGLPGAAATLQNFRVALDRLLSTHSSDLARSSRPLAQSR